MLALHSAKTTVTVVCNSIVREKFIRCTARDFSLSSLARPMLPAGRREDGARRIEPWR